MASSRNVESLGCAFDVGTPGIIGRAGRDVIAAGVRGIAGGKLRGTHLRALGGAGGEQCQHTCTAGGA